MPDLYRRQIKHAIVSALQLHDDVVGCWEDGSAAKLSCPRMRSS